MIKHKPSAALAEYERASEVALKAYNYALEPLRAEHRRAERAAQEAYARALAKEHRAMIDAAPPAAQDFRP